PVDRSDDRHSHRHDEVRMPRADQLADVGPACAVDGGIADRVQAAHVRTGTEGSSLARNHDGPDSAIGLRIVETLVERGGETAAPAVHPLGPIEGQHRDTSVANLVQDRVGVAGHAHPANLLNSGFQLDVFPYCTPISSVFRNRFAALFADQTEALIGRANLRSPLLWQHRLRWPRMRIVPDG